MLEEYFDLFDTDAKKVVLYHENKPTFDHLIDVALERYMKQRKMDRPGDNRIITGFNWEVPEERIYDADTHKINTETDNHAMTPFVEYNNASSPEKHFVEFLEKNSSDIDWWYKNGDKGKMHYAIPYGGHKGDESLFYPDFIIRMKNGRIYIFDTKTKESDVDAPDKHNALIDYLKKENEKGKNLRGGVIINQPAGTDVWRYCPLNIENTYDLTGWSRFDPKNA